MNKFIFILNASLILASLLGTLSAHGMENSEQLTSQAEEYNNNNCFLNRLPIDIFSHCLIQDTDQIKSLENSIKNFMRLSITCKSFNQSLTFEAIGNFCKNYAQIYKSQTLKNLIKTMETNYEMNRPLALILICAGTNASLYTLNSGMLLTIATGFNDTQLIKTLFKYHANQNANADVCKSASALFKAKTIEMAQIFIDNGADVHCSSINQTNALWAALRSGYSSELIKLYLAFHVDTKLRNRWDNSCLFHQLVKAQQVYAVDTADDLLEKAKLLLDAIPDMINAVDKYGRTPIDVAQLRLNQHHDFNDDPEVLKQLITLYREHGCKTAQQDPVITVSYQSWCTLL